MIFADIIGTINNPTTYSGYDTLQGANKGLTLFITNLVYLIMTLAGLFTLVNLILAGYLYLGSNGNPQQITAAANKILQSLIGLVVVAAAFVIANLIGYLLFQDPNFLFKPQFMGITP